MRKRFFSILPMLLMVVVMLALVFGAHANFIDPAP